MNENGKNTIAKVLISGKVHGVYFRETTKKKAREDNLRGWVENLCDNENQVEAVFEGPTELIKKIVSWCLTGPKRAKVNKLVVSFEDAPENGPSENELPDPFDARY